MSDASEYADNGPSTAGDDDINSIAPNQGSQGLQLTANNNSSAVERCAGSLCKGDYRSTGQIEGLGQFSLKRWLPRALAGFIHRSYHKLAYIACHMSISGLYFRRQFDIAAT